MTKVTNMVWEKCSVIRSSQQGKKGREGFGNVFKPYYSNGTCGPTQPPKSGPYHSTEREMRRETERVMARRENFLQWNRTWIQHHSLATCNPQSTTCMSKSVTDLLSNNVLLKSITWNCQWRHTPTCCLREVDLSRLIMTNPDWSWWNNPKPACHFSIISAN